MTDYADKLMKSRCRLMVREPFYGHMAMKISWIPSNMDKQKHSMSKTMGVRIVNGGEIQCLYYPPFIEMSSIEELYGVIQHEIEHLIRCHCLRIGNRDPKLFNYAADMAVNGKKNNPRIGYKETDGSVILPLGGNIVWIPEEWDSSGTTEYYYDLLRKNDSSIKDHNILDNHDVWDDTDISHDEIRQIVKNAVDEATVKANGQIPKHLADSIAQLSQPLISWTQYLRIILGRYIGNKRRTFSRKNRRNRSFGTKGISRRAANEIIVVLDTSGSINDKELCQFFTEIESLSHKTKMWLLQWDNIYRDFNLYRKGDWKKIAVKGRGSTDMAAPVEWLIENKLTKDLLIMLTDGYCNYCDPKCINFICVVTTDDEYTNYPSWGHIIHLNNL